MPLPARHLTRLYRDQYRSFYGEDPTCIETTRGCPYRCTFCSVWIFHKGSFRSKSPERVLKELESAASLTILFVDDNFLQDVDRATRIYQLVKDAGIQARYFMQARASTMAQHPQIIERWAELGLSAVFVGFETPNADELANYHKNTSLEANKEAARILRENGVDIWGSFIIDPQWTEHDFDTLIEYVRSLGTWMNFFNVLTPLPGTVLFKNNLEKLCTRDYRAFDFLHSVLSTRLPPEEFYANMARLYSRTNVSWREIRKRVKTGTITPSGVELVYKLHRDLSNPQTYLRNMEHNFVIPQQECLGRGGADVS